MDPMRSGLAVALLLAVAGLSGCTKQVREPEFGLRSVESAAEADGPPDLSRGRYLDHADRHLMSVYAKRPFEAYCSCEIALPSKVVSLERCGYVPKTPTDPNNLKMHWEHVFPKKWVATSMGCTSSAACKADPDTAAEYLLAENDLYNLVPSVGSLNMRRSDHWLWEVPGETRAFGDCDFELTRIGDEIIVEPPDKHKGNLARVILYFIEQHAIEIPDEAIELYLQWHRGDPVDDEEMERASAIAEIVGYVNPWVAGDR